MISGKDFVAKLDAAIKLANNAGHPEIEKALWGLMMELPGHGSTSWEFYPRKSTQRSAAAK